MTKQYYIVWMLLALLAGCGGGSLIQKPTTFEQSLAMLQGQCTQVRRDAVVLLSTNKITSAQAEEVQKQADLCRVAVATSRQGLSGLQCSMQSDAANACTPEQLDPIYAALNTASVALNTALRITTNGK